MTKKAEHNETMVKYVQSNVHDIERIIRVYAQVSENKREALLVWITKWRKKVDIANWKQLTELRYDQLNQLESEMARRVPDYYLIHWKLTPTHLYGGHETAIEDRHFKQTGKFLRDSVPVRNT